MSLKTSKACKLVFWNGNLLCLNIWQGIQGLIHFLIYMGCIANVVIQIGKSGLIFDAKLKKKSYSDCVTLHGLSLMCLWISNELSMQPNR